MAIVRGGGESSENRYLLNVAAGRQYPETGRPIDDFR